MLIWAALTPSRVAETTTRVVGRLFHGLGEQRERADRCLELVADVGDEVPPDLLHPAALRLVFGEEQDEAATAEGGAQRRHPHREAGPPAAERATGHLDL